MKCELDFVFVVRCQLHFTSLIIFTSNKSVLLTNSSVLFGLKIYDIEILNRFVAIKTIMCARVDFIILSSSDNSNWMDLICIQLNYFWKIGSQTAFISSFNSYIHTYISIIHTDMQKTWIKNLRKVIHSHKIEYLKKPQREREIILLAVVIL